MLVRLMYCSRTKETISQDDLTAIMVKSRTSNPQHGITGVLCCSGRIFLQVLESGRLEINKLYNKIANDPRHQDVGLLSYEEIDERSFAHGSLRHVWRNRINPALVIKN